MQNKITIASKIWQGIKLFFKWLWLITMFILGCLIFLGMPFTIFEYSFSFFEVDLMETAMIVFILVFTYYYIKLCKRNKVALVRKIMTPFVHQGHMLLLFCSVSLVSTLAFDLDLNSTSTLPMGEIMRNFLLAGTLLYSYYRIDVVGTQSQSPIVETNMEGVTE